MEREILFRGERIDGSGTIQGDLIRWNGDVFIVPINYAAGDEHFSDLLCEFEVIPETVGQFTGITDKVGKKIFEGDIVTAYGDRRGVVEYGIARFGINWDYGTNKKTMLGSWGSLDNLRSLNDDLVYELEIIGNIIDNSELIFR